MVRTIPKFRSLVAAFEGGRVLARDWNHQTRFVLGLWYVLNPSKDGPNTAMQRGIGGCESRLHGTQARHCINHEAITAFYMERIKTFAISAPPDLGLLELTNALPLSELADPRLHFGLFHSEFQPSDATTAPLIEFAPYDCRPAAFSAFARAWEQMELMRAV